MRVTGQTRAPFGLSYRTLIGNDTAGTDYGYEIHLVYNATAGVTSRDHETVNDSPDAIEFSWDFSTLPVDVQVQTICSSYRFITDTDPEFLKLWKTLSWYRV